MNPRRFLSLSPFLLVIAPATLAAQNGTGRAYCSSQVGDTVVYIAPVFDDHLKAGSAYRSRFMSTSSPST